MKPFAVRVRYRYAEAGGGGEDRAACFRGLFFDRSERAVLARLRELHRFAARVEVLEVLWSDARPAAPAAPAGGR